MGAGDQGPEKGFFRISLGRVNEKDLIAGCLETSLLGLGDPERK